MSHPSPVEMPHGRDSEMGEINADGQKENRRMGRLTGQSRHVRMAVLIALVGILALGGCSKKNVMATTEGTGNAQAGGGGTTEGGPGGSGGSMGEGGSAPLQGFSRSPSEESVKAPTPPVVAKADPAEIAARQARAAAQRRLADIYFAFDRWALSSEGMKNLTENADFLRQNPTVKLLIEGHCDERGSREYNMVLGEKRAQETRQYLKALDESNADSVVSL